MVVISKTPFFSKPKQISSLTSGTSPWLFEPWTSSAVEAGRLHSWLAPSLTLSFVHPGKLTPNTASPGLLHLLVSSGAQPMRGWGWEEREVSSCSRLFLPPSSQKPDVLCVAPWHNPKSSPGSDISGTFFLPFRPWGLTLTSPLCLTPLVGFLPNSAKSLFISEIMYLPFSDKWSQVCPAKTLTDTDRWGDLTGLPLFRFLDVIYIFMH